MKLYYKLVRDNIPDIISAQGKSIHLRILSDAEYLDSLNAKLDEELAEYHESGSVEELADLLEVIYAIANAKGYPSHKLNNIRQEKAAERGRFNKKIMLLSVDEPTSY